MGIMKNLGLLLTAILLVSLAGPANTVLAKATTVEVNSGQTITLAPGGSQGNIPLDIKGIPDLGPDNGVGGFTFNLSWNPDVIHVDNITAATIAGFNILAGIPNNTTGNVTTTGFSLGFTYLTGDATVATLKISAVGNPGYSTPIYVTITSLGDKDGNPISATPVNVSVQLSGAPPSYTLSMATNGGGSTTPAVGHHLYPADTVVNISATPDAGWQFVNWSGEVADPDSASTTVAVNTNKTVTANFNQITYTLTMAVNGGGSTIPAVGTHPYPVGTVVNITATPDAGWRFVNWTGDVADSNSANTTFTTNTDKTVTANFMVAEKTNEPLPHTQPQPQKDKSVEPAEIESDAPEEAPMPPSPPEPVGTVINWPIVWGAIAGAIVVGLLVFFLIRRRAY